ncbi:hypothetical protein KIH86_25360 [Paenibacillus sp. HN-1]|uniref:hypothetical protein n=1 Tax=Paenibacillus TaxID=44249 RepID=UPI001CA7F936|nr:MULTISPECIES: hypothetical protein [Paenibacillus]MBY9082624.1 hypothetical protein [Paenibacillus sp. CGMCC 1.18879]MBY9087520.1 hypothetical protein [Paenibacillus sinensis]
MGSNAAAYNNADTIQKVINDDLFPSVASVSDVKQVLEFMTDYAAPLSEEQIRAILLLEHLGANERLHGKVNPYSWIIKDITGKHKRAVSRTETFLRTIEELIPKPPKPIIFADGRPMKGRG